jgi:mRNA interferase HicA
MKSSELLRILKRDGWFVVSQQGSHIKMRHETKAGTLIVPSHGSKEMATGTQNAILKQAGLK